MSFLAYILPLSFWNQESTPKPKLHLIVFSKLRFFMRPQVRFLLISSAIVVRTALHEHVSAPPAHSTK